jgi:hypothetical protein
LKEKNKFSTGFLPRGENNFGKKNKNWGGIRGFRKLGGYVQNDLFKIKKF